MGCRNPNYSTQFYNFLTETYNKERDARLAWYFKTKQNSDQTRKPKQLEVFRRKIESSIQPEDLLNRLPKIVREPKHNRKKKDPVDIKLDSSIEFVSDMRPVTPKTRRKLFQGVTDEGKGRYQYLYERYQKIPEEKYEYPLQSSWDYGWRLSDFMKTDEIKKPAHCRTKIVADTFYTRNGIPWNGINP